MTLPYIPTPDLDLGLRIPIHVFGVIVAIGVVTGAAVMRRYALRQGASDPDIRAVTGWVTVTGIIGAHVLDVIMYRPGELVRNPVVVLEVWTSISSYGGFIGGGLGFLYIIRRRRLRFARWADITIVGLLLAFSIGRVGCTAVHDHVGAQTRSSIGVDFPRQVLVERGHADLGSAAPVIRAHDLGFEELLYLIPVNVLVLWLAFRRRLPAGALAALTAALYAPVRFGLEHWRLAATDPPYGGLTFAQWGSIAVFVVAVTAGVRLVRRGADPPPTQPA